MRYCQYPTVDNFFSLIMNLGTENYLTIGLLVKFLLLYGNVPIPVWRETGMGFYLMSGEATNKVKEIPHESRMAYYKLPMNGLAGVMK